MKRLTLLVLVIFTGTIFAFAQHQKMNTELRKQIKAYTLKNVVPVIAKERVEFDKLLSDDEKEIIETARQKIQVRKIMFKNWYDSEDFEPGKRAKDPNFEEMRADMQKSMAEVRDVAIAHNTEIRESLGDIAVNKPKWVNDIETIIEENNEDPERIKRVINKKLHKRQTPVSFLLFNPDKAKDNDVFGFNKNDDMKVIVYPNPVFENATIAVINADDKDVEVVLLTKDGKVVNTLYDNKNDKQRLEVMLNVSDLNQDVYLIKVITNDRQITRKIIIKK